MQSVADDFLAGLVYSRDLNVRSHAEVVGLPTAQADFGPGVRYFALVTKNWRRWFWQTPGFHLGHIRINPLF